MQTKYEYLLFEKAAQQPLKTSVWECKNAYSGTVLGIVKWYSGWRQYCYCPTVHTVYGPGYLKDITDFMGQLKEEKEK